MKTNQQIPFPKNLLGLSQVEKIDWYEQYAESFHAYIPLLYEAAFDHGMDVLKPWEIPDQSIPSVINEWEKIKEELTIKFSNRDHAVGELMRKGIALFYEVLYWSNNQPVVLDDQIDGNMIKPINSGERLKFILSRMNNYHSFVQLTELFIEMEKLFWKHQVIMKKASKH
jgi:hypothetical protein